MPETTIDKALFQAERHGHSTVMVLTRDLREVMDENRKLSDTVAALQASAQKSASTQDAA